jgi:hypothetical protein
LSASAAQAAAFYRDVAKSQRLWTVARNGHFAAVPGHEGTTVQPFWSARSRVERIIKRVAVYAGSEPIEVTWAAFRDEWLPRFRRDRVLVGVNWSGAAATGYDSEPDWVQHCVEVEIERLGGPPATPLEKVIKDGLVVGHRLVQAPKGPPRSA